MEYRRSEYSNLVIDVDIETPTPPSRIPHNPSPIEVEHIGLIFTFRERRRHFDVSENGERRLVWQREGLRYPLCDHQFRSEIFNRGDDSLFCYLACSFQNFEEEGIDAESVADALIDRWIEIREEANSRSSNRVFSMTVNLTMWYVQERREISAVDADADVEEEDCGMIPACGGAVTEMLKRFEREDGDGSCVICLDELRKKKKNGKCGLLQMPCLHVFHGDCIKEWLSNSHFCPICRFQMPIDFN